MKKVVAAWPRITWRVRCNRYVGGGLIIGGYTLCAGKVYAVDQAIDPHQTELSFLPRGFFRHYAMRYIRTLLKKELKEMQYEQA